MGGCVSKRPRPVRSDSAQHLMKLDEATHLRRIWRYHIEPVADRFFDQTLHAALKRSAIIRQAMGILDPNFERDQTACAYVSEVAARVMEFLKVVCLDMNDLRFDVAKRKANELGARHLNYGGGTFQPIYWDIFILSMTERLEKEPAVTPIEIYIWQKFVRQIVEWMREGHELGAALAPRTATI